MDIKISEYKLSAKRSKTAYLNVLNRKLKGYKEEINKINAEIDNFKKRVINPNSPQMKLKLKHSEEIIKENEINIETTELFKNELSKFVEPKMPKEPEEIKKIYNNLKKEYNDLIKLSSDEIHHRL